MASFDNENKRNAISSVTLILVGNMLTTYNNIGTGWTATITAIIGFIIFFMGLDKLKSLLDDSGKAAVKLLINATIIGIIALVIDLIPLIGGIFAKILYLIAFIIQLVGLLKLKDSKTIGETGVAGVNNLLIAMVIMVIGSIISIFPGGEFINSVISFAAFLLILFGWLKIQDAMISVCLLSSNNISNNTSLFCSNCGTANKPESTSSFCENCGQKL